MKAFLVLCLLVSISSFDFFKTGFCLLGNEKLRTIAKDVISSLKSQDFTNAISLVISNLEEIKNIVVDCLELDKKNDDDDDIVLQCKTYEECLQDCATYHPKSNLCKAACVFSSC